MNWYLAKVRQQHMNEKLQLPSIFSFTNYREYLAVCLEHLKVHHAMSARSLSRICAITSPNYFQQLISEKRNLTPLIAARIGEAFRLTKSENDYLLALIKLNAARSGLMKEAALKKMHSIVQKSERKLIEDSSFHSNWGNALVWEMLKTRHFTRDSLSMRELLRQAISVEEIESAIAYFEKKNLLTLTPDQAQQKSIDFKPSNDMRRINIQRSHLRFLQLAEHRLNDPLDQREYQGLTVAIKKESFEKIRTLCREFIHSLNDQFAVDSDGDEVIRVQLCAFKLSRESSR